MPNEAIMEVVAVALVDTDVDGDRVATTDTVIDGDGNSVAETDGDADCDDAPPAVTATDGVAVRLVGDETGVERPAPYAQTARTTWLEPSATYKMPLCNAMPTGPANLAAVPRPSAKPKVV